jgi:3-methyladenine DNA glycosylase AlkD
MFRAKDALTDLQALANSRKAIELQRFFKTGPGDYAEGDIFLGIVVPKTRIVAKKYSDLPIVEIKKLIESQYHEVRFCGLLILLAQFEKAKSRSEKKKLFEFYLKQLKAGYVNNWDLIDVTGVRMGAYLIDERAPMAVLRRLAKSDDLWEKRMSIIFTFAFQRVGDMDPTLEIADLLLKDDHDLIHKAVGWALREVGKKDGPMLRNYLKANVAHMPRTTLRYAIEKFSAAERKRWLNS